MPKKYTSEKFWKLYETLPQELKDAIFSEETGNDIHDVCQNNDTTEHIDGIVDMVGQVLVGMLPAENFQEEIEKELGIEKDIAKKIAQEINRLIFYPVRPALEVLYGVSSEEKKKTFIPQKTIKTAVPAEPEEEIAENDQEPIQKSPDTYRESLE
jgi:hypothetical protein